MGEFSWMDCRKGERRNSIKFGQRAYMLVPKEFGENVETCGYDGYGTFGGLDVYEQVALWNRKHLTTKMLRVPHYYGPEYDECFDRDLRWYKHMAKMIYDFVNDEDDEVMREKYGDEYLRTIGIEIACDDEQNKALPYPIKISHESVPYEDCNYSRSDPNQGYW